MTITGLLGGPRLVGPVADLANILTVSRESSTYFRPLLVDASRQGQDLFETSTSGGHEERLTPCQAEGTLVRLSRLYALLMFSLFG